MVIQPLPGGGQSWHRLAILVDLHEVLEDVKRDPRPVIGMFIDDPEFPSRCWDLFPHAALVPPPG
jgi:hypothetical protein